MPDKQPSKPFENIEAELAKMTGTGEAVRGNGGAPAAANSVMDACIKAADKIRGIAAQEIAEGEAVAVKLRDIGETFAKRMTQVGEEFRAIIENAANEVSKLRALPKEAAENSANILTEIASAEAARHQHVHAGLSDLRSALDHIASVDNKRPNIPAPRDRSRDIVRGDPRINQQTGDF
jgi:hypothetical protein